MIVLSETVGEQLETRIERMTGPAPHADVYRLLNEARPFLPPTLFFALEAAINAERVTVTEAAFLLGWQAHADPGRWIFGTADAAG